MRQEVILSEFASRAKAIGHKALFVTTLFGKQYVMMRDAEGTHYLEKVERPMTEVSVDG